MKAVVFIVTFFSYALYHSSRKTLSGVKASVTTDWLDNSTHAPFFIDGVEARTFLGTLDAVFMISYAAGLFFWGWLGERLNPKHVIAAGMVGSGFTLILFGAVPKWCNFYHAAYYLFTYVLFGLLQACGWPSEIAIMTTLEVFRRLLTRWSYGAGCGSFHCLRAKLFVRHSAADSRRTHANWFGKANRGFIMGLWASCQPIGNVFGSFFTAWVLPLGYQNTFFINGLLMLVGALVVMIAIDPKPRGDQYSEVHDPTRERSHSEEGQPISFVKAILLPGVFAYCLCNACLKLVNYAFFFWLPLYLTEAYHWEEAKADQLSIWYDVGGIIGSVGGGYISDKMRCRAPLIVAMLTGSLFSLFVYARIGPELIWNVLVMTVVGITVSGPYNLIVGTISIDLGSQPILASNAQAMSTVSGLLDGTGSAGSAVGQLFIPMLQVSLGWESVFYLFILLNALAILCILRRCVKDLRMLLATTPELAPLLGDHGSHED